MKWFQHYSDSYTNLKLQSLMEDFGLMGYGFFWLCCELVAQQGSSYKLKTTKNWRKALKKISKLSEKTMDLLLRKLADLNLINKKALQKGDLWIPKMQEYAEEYTKRKSKGQILYYGPNWKKQKRLCRQRDRWICQKCGKTTEENKRSLEVHHIISPKKFPILDENGRISGIDWNEANDLSNLISVCISCHNKLKWNGYRINPDFSKTNPQQEHNTTLHNTTIDKKTLHKYDDLKKPFKKKSEFPK